MDQWVSRTQSSRIAVGSQPPPPPVLLKEMMTTKKPLIQKKLSWGPRKEEKMLEPEKTETKV